MRSGHGDRSTKLSGMKAEALQRRKKPRELAQAGPTVARRGGGHRAQDQRTMFAIYSNVALAMMSATQGPVRGGYVDQ